MEQQRPEWLEEPQQPKKAQPFLIKLAINLGIGVILCFIIMLILGVFKVESDLVIRKLCDSFFVTAILLLGFGGLSYVAGEGLFVGFSYFFRNIMPGRKPISYRDYYDKRMEKGKKSKSGILPVIIAGGVFLIIAIIFLFI